MLIIATVTVLLCSFIIAVQGESRSFSKLLLIIVLYACTQVIITELLLGVVIQKLTSSALLAANGIVLLAAFLLFYRRTPEKRFYYLIDNVIKDIRKTKISLFTWALIGLAVLVIGYVVYLGYLFPPYAYDSLTYHLPPVASWIQNEKISFISGVDGFSNYYPKNAELLYLWNLILFKNDIWVDLIQFIFWGIGCITVYAISNQFIRLDKQSSLIAGMIFFFTPIGLMQSKTCYVDVIFTVFILISVYFVLDYLINNDARSIWLASLAMAILLGIKPQSFLYIFILYTLLLYKTIRDHRFNWPRIILSFIGVLFLLISISGYWYIKNYIVFHNPLYPFEIKIFNTLIFPGFMSLKSFHDYDIASRGGFPRVLILMKNWLEVNGYYQYDAPNGGLGILWFTMMLPAIVWKLSVAWKNREKAYLYLFFIIFFCFIFQPLNWLSRYVLYITALGSISLAWCLNNIQYRKIMAGLIILMITYQVILLSHQNYFSLDKVVLFQNIRPEKRSAALFSGSQSMMLLDILSNKGDIVYFQDMYPNFTYLLWGNHLERKVYALDNNVLPSIDSTEKNVFFVVGEKSPVLPMLLQNNHFLLVYKDQNNYYLFIPNNHGGIQNINSKLNSNILGKT